MIYNHCNNVTLNVCDLHHNDHDDDDHDVIYVRIDS